MNSTSNSFEYGDNPDDTHIESLIVDLFNKNCIRLGKFTLKNGSISPIYIDLKNIITYPYLNNIISSYFINKIKNIETDYVCGIPYGGIPIASIISNKMNLPMLMVRKEVKTYGLKKSIEGEFERGKTCLLIEDTITTGGSITNFINLLSLECIQVKHVFVICDRRDNTIIPPLGYTITSLFNLLDIFKTLKKHDLIKYKINSDFNIDLLNSYIIKKFGIFADFNSKKKSLKRHDKTTSVLIDIILRKQTNICFSIEEQEEIEIKDFVKIIGKIANHICILKMNSNNIRGFNETYKKALIKMANELEFMIYDNTLISQKSEISVPWCNLQSVIALETIVSNIDSINMDSKRDKIIDNKGFVLYGLTPHSPINLNLLKETKNIVIYEGNNDGLSLETKMTSLFLSESIDFDTYSRYDVLSDLIENELINNNMDLITITKKKDVLENFEKCIIVSKTIAWSMYSKKIQ